jgi:hypothetical protein
VVFLCTFWMWGEGDCIMLLVIEVNMGNAVLFVLCWRLKMINYQRVLDAIIPAGVSMFWGELSGLTQKARGYISRDDFTALLGVRVAPWREESYKWRRSEVSERNRSIGTLFLPPISA